MAKYQPSPELPEELRREFQRVADAITNPEQEIVTLAQINTAPVRWQNGMIAWADGTNWNPAGGGQGFYCLYGGTWKKMG